MNREWTGIDRLRLDKFYMVRLPAAAAGMGGVGVGLGELGARPRAMWPPSVSCPGRAAPLSTVTHKSRGPRVARHVPCL